MDEKDENMTIKEAIEDIRNECKTLHDFELWVTALFCHEYPELSAISEKLAEAAVKSARHIEAVKKLRAAETPRVIEELVLKIDPRAKARHEIGLTNAAKAAGLEVEITYRRQERRHNDLKNPAP